MRKTVKEALVMIVQAVVVGLAFSIAICGGAILMGTISSNIKKTQTVTVESQHQKLIDETTYLYCPYCGQKLER
jgi:DNA-directed RNA polymerase subunit RPC12/RpoP